MSRFISVPVLWNFENSFQNNSLVNINIDSKFVAIVSKPAAVYPPATMNPTTVANLQIEDPNLGTLYLNMPYSAYQDAIRAASGSAAPLVQTIMITVSGSPSTITNASLSGAQLVAVWNGGVLYNMDLLSLSGDTITFPDPLSDGDVIGIIFYTS